MIEYRTAAGGVQETDGSVSGLVTPFGVETVIGDPKRGGFRESIAPGAFKKTLQERDIVFLFNHNTDMPLARTSAGNLDLREDPTSGLKASATPVDTSYGQDLLKLTRAKVVKGMSFGFEVIKDAWQDDQGRASNENVGTKRTIQEVRLHEVSAVTFPAYETTTFSARDAISAARGIKPEVRDDGYGTDDTGLGVNHVGISAALLDSALSDLDGATDQLPPAIATVVQSLSLARDHLAMHLGAMPPGTDAGSNADSDQDVAGESVPVTGAAAQHTIADSSPQTFDGLGRSTEPATTTPEDTRHLANLAALANIYRNR